MVRPDINGHGLGFDVKKTKRRKSGRRSPVNENIRAEKINAKAKGNHY